MKYKIVFESERIRFIKVNKELIQDYLEMINNEEIQKSIGKKRMTYTYEQEAEWVLKNSGQSSRMLSMIEKETNDFIGNIGINKIENNVGELGICITPKKQNKHFGQEAIEAFLNYSFNVLGLDAMDLNVFKFNERGIHCYEKLGFKRDSVEKIPGEIHMLKRK